MFEFVYKNILIVYIKMFYIISSRIPLISSDKTNRKYFKLFVSGAVSYVLLHYYLNKEVRSGMVEKIRKYIYYVMCIDFTIACVLLKYIKTNVPDTDENDDENDEDNQKSNKNINNPQKLSRELEEQRRLFLEEHQRKILQDRILQEKAQTQARSQQQEKKSKVKTESEKTESEKPESEKTESEKTESEKKHKKSEKKVEKNQKKRQKKRQKKKILMKKQM